MEVAKEDGPLFLFYHRDWFDCDDQPHNEFHQTVRKVLQKHGKKLRGI